jgi:hypothetical protein
MAKIKKLVDAFSMQPYSYEICEMGGYHEHGEYCIAHIELKVNPDRTRAFYGYNFSVKLLFEIQVESVNVFYYPE